jgi:hypothetical protein
VFVGSKTKTSTFHEHVLLRDENQRELTAMFFAAENDALRLDNPRFGTKPAPEQYTTLSDRLRRLQGIVTVKVDPLPSELSIVISPPSSSVYFLTIYSPKPAPP